MTKSLKGKLKLPYVHRGHFAKHDSGAITEQGWSVSQMTECPDVRIRIPRRRWPKSWSNIADLLVPIELDIRLQNCALKHSNKGECAELDDMQMAGKNQNMTPMWKKLMTDNDLDEPTSFLDQMNLGCTQRECELNEKKKGETKTPAEFVQSRLWRPPPPPLSPPAMSMRCVLSLAVPGSQGPSTRGGARVRRGTQNQNPEPTPWTLNREP